MRIHHLWLYDFRIPVYEEFELLASELMGDDCILQESEKIEGLSRNLSGFNTRELWNACCVGFATLNNTEFLDQGWQVNSCRVLISFPNGFGAWETVFVVRLFASLMSIAPTLKY
jgi:hypothetical protein